MIDAILDVSETVRMHALDAVTAVSISPTGEKHPKRIVPTDMRKVLAAGGAALSFRSQTDGESK